jgi:hypothetical protein
MVQAMIGWIHGAWHWNLIAQLYLPFGAYINGNLVDIGIDHWSSDLSVAATYLDPHNRLKISFSPGLTFNWENESTQYRTGTEFHGEFAVLKHFNETWALGIAGYYYHEITGDSGPGARIGSFEGRAVRLGPILTRNVTVDGKQVTTSTRWLHGYYAVNRTTGATPCPSVSGSRSTSAPRSSRGHAGTPRAAQEAIDRTKAGHLLGAIGPGRMSPAGRDVPCRPGPPATGDPAGRGA